VILAIALAFAVQEAPQDELNIEVVGRKLAAISATVGRNSAGKLACALSASSGYAKLDAQLCRTATACVRKGAATQDTVSACIDKRKPELLADFKRSWRNGQ
jgi:hypothetical protein